MHQALKVPEILQLILFHIHDPKQARSRHGRGELRPGSYWDIAPLASLARTCKYLSRPSLDVLWYYQTDLKPLLKCLPDDLLRRQTDDYDPEKLSLKREFRREDFTRVDLYARRIRILGDPETERVISSPDREDVDAMIYSRIVSRRSLWGLGPFLPSLIHLRIGLEKFYALAWYPRLIIGPQLQIINLVGFREDIDNEDYDVDWENIFAALFPALPSLNSLSFSIHAAYSHPADGDIYAIDGSKKDIQMKIIRTIPSPAVLDVISAPLDPKTIHYVVNLQTIQVLAISIIFIDPSHPLVQKLPELPNLLELRVEANDPNFCCAVIRQLGSKHLRSLTVIRVEMSRHLWDPEGFIRSLRTSRFVTSIDSIEVITPTYQVRPDPKIPPITRDTIHQLSHFKNLRSIRLYLNGEVHLDAENLETVASVWPNLQVLDLRSRTRLGNADPRISLNDLLVVSVKLPALKEVRLQVDVQKELKYAATTLPASGISATKLEILDVCTSPISNTLVAEVATTLGAAFPNLREFLYGWKWPERYGEDPLKVELSRREEVSLHGWERVKEMLRLNY